MKKISLIYIFICQLLNHKIKILNVFIIFFSTYFCNAQSNEQIYKSIYVEEFKKILLFSGDFIYFMIQ